MLAAFLNGVVGSVLVIFIGLSYLSLSWGDAFLCILSSNIALLISLLATLQAEQRPGVLKSWITRSRRAWAFFFALYFSIILALAPPLRQIQNLIYLFIPLVLCTGFGIILFGPIQDLVVRRNQRKKTRLIR